MATRRRGDSSVTPPNDVVDECPKCGHTWHGLPCARGTIHWLPGAFARLATTGGPALCDCPTSWLEAT